MKHQNNLPEAYIRDAIHNPLLFQQNNPLISQSMSLLNSRMKKSFDSELQQFTSKELSKGSGRRGKWVKQTQESNENDDIYENQEEEDEIENLNAIKQFQREIEEKFKISVANKLFTFPRLKITSIMDIISSSESQDDEQPASQPSSSQQPSTQFNPFDQIHYQNRLKTQHLADKSISQKSNEDDGQRNFKKVKQPNIKILDDTKKHKQKKNQSLKKQQQQNYSHRQKTKPTKKNPQVSMKEKQKPKHPTKPQKSSANDHPPHLKPQQPWAIKQPHHKHNIQRLKTQMNNDSSRQSDSITQSKKRFYQEEFFIRR